MLELKHLFVPALVQTDEHVTGHPRGSVTPVKDAKICTVLSRAIRIKNRRFGGPNHPAPAGNDRLLPEEKM